MLKPPRKVWEVSQPASVLSNLSAWCGARRAIRGTFTIVNITVSLLNTQTREV